jgi:hypothetical protein
MTLTGIVIKNIIRKLLAGEDYQPEIVALIDAEFLQYVRFAHRRLRLTVVEFFRRMVEAKFKNESVTTGVKLIESS